MNDELVKQLRNGCEGSHVEAADRIEELEAALNTAAYRLMVAAKKANSPSMTVLYAEWSNEANAAFYGQPPQV
jgi:hypothetical protein